MGVFIEWRRFAGVRPRGAVLALGPPFTMAPEETDNDGIVVMGNARRSGAKGTPKPKAASDKSRKRGSSAEAEHRAHTPEVAGSTPAPATSAADSAAVLAHLAHLKPGPRRFAIEYLKDHKGGQAYQRAGYTATGNAAEVNASRLLRNAQVAAAIAKAEHEMLAKVQEQTGITLERVLREIAKGAFFDPRRFFSENGAPKPITELDDDTAAVLAGMDMLEEYRGSGEERQFVGYVKKYKLASRKEYLDMLMKHLGGYEADNRQRSDPLAELMAIVWGQGSKLPTRP